MKQFKGLYDSLYKKWELYLVRLFQIAKYVEDQIKFPKLSAPDMEEVLNPEGYNGYIRIPPNPFFVKDEDNDVFFMFFDHLECRDDDKALKRFFVEVWERIGIIKRFLGITRNTRYIGEPLADKRLVNEIDVYLKYPDSCSSLHTLILGRCPESKHEYDDFLALMRQFKNFLLDREPINSGDVKSYDHY